MGMVRGIVTKPILFVYIPFRNVLMRLVCQYTGWLTAMDPLPDPNDKQPRKKTEPSLATKIWGGCMYVLTYLASRRTYQLQGGLRHLPVPSLRPTIDKYVESLRPICSEVEMQEIQQGSQQFLSLTGGYVLQTLLVLRSWVVDNYVSDWWGTYVYLSSRDTLLINSNYYGLDYGLEWPTDCQLSRAALLTQTIAKWWDLLEDETVEPLKLRGFIPMCMDQYKLMLGTSRVPRLSPAADEIVHYTRAQGSVHAAVLIDGHFYRLGLYIEDTPQKGLKSVERLREELQAMVEDAAQAPACAQIAMLTAWGRDEWAVVRPTHIPKRTLQMIEQSVFVCCLPSGEAPATASELGTYVLGANKGTGMWLDKSFNLCVFSDGKAGFNAEHSTMDGTTLGHMWEWVLADERISGYEWATQLEARKTVSCEVERYDVTGTAELQESIRQASKSLEGFADDIDVHQILYDKVGQAAIKKQAKVSPDGFVQLAIQLAWRRLHGGVVPVYEPCMMRLFLKGRTDTIRSVTDESAAFTQQFDNDETTNEQKRRLLANAVFVHSKQTRQNMAFGGIDRHLFGLAVLAMGLNSKFGWFAQETAFLKSALTRPWTISSSQVPQSQLTSVGLDEDMNVPGLGGFGAVDKTGYGVGYCFIGKNRVMLTVTSYHSCERTSSQRFFEALTQSMEDMMAIC